MDTVLRIVLYVRVILILLLLPFVISLPIYFGLLPVGGATFFYGENDTHSLTLIIAVTVISIGLQVFAEIDRKTNGDVKLKQED